MVSVIIPNYNHAAYLKQRIDSVINQTYSDIEIIILDDNSTDNSREIIGQYCDHPKVSVISCNKNNSGSTFRQWQKGIHLAKGKYIWIAESDDCADERFLETVIPVMEKDPALGIIQVQSYNIDQYGKVHGVFPNQVTKRDWNCDFKEDGRKFIKECMLFDNPIMNASAVVFRKSYIQENSPDTTYTLNGDWHFYIQLLLNSGFYNIGTPLSYFRQHTNKGSSHNVKNYNNIIEYARLTGYIFNQVNLDKKKKDTVRYVFVSKWVQQANYSFVTILKNRFFTISAIAIKNDAFFLLRLIKRIIKK